MRIETGTKNGIDKVTWSRNHCSRSQKVNADPEVARGRETESASVEHSTEVKSQIPQSDQSPWDQSQVSPQQKETEEVPEMQETGWKAELKVWWKQAVALVGKE